MKEIEVKEKVEVGGVVKLEDLEGFVEKVVLVEGEDLELVCKDCERIMR